MATANYHAYGSPDAMRSVSQVGPAGRFRESVVLLLRMLDRQRQRRALLDLDDHQLEDIGKSRREARDEARKPFWK